MKDKTLTDANGNTIFIQAAPLYVQLTTNHPDGVILLQKQQLTELLKILKKRDRKTHDINERVGW